MTLKFIWKIKYAKIDKKKKSLKEVFIFNFVRGRERKEEV